MKRVKKKAADEVRPEYNLKRLRVRKLGSGRLQVTCRRALLDRMPATEPR
jgi:hypothetical protein